ncbi:MAG: hypothetical protein IJT90_01525 [Bacteroidaceae bacterium]|nr:hypothetical protein [Bacteroidaceae bacterium]
MKRIKRFWGICNQKCYSPEINRLRRHFAENDEESIKIVLAKMMSGSRKNAEQFMSLFCFTDEELSDFTFLPADEARSFISRLIEEVHKDKGLDHYFSFFRRNRYPLCLLLLMIITLVLEYMRK